MRYWPTELFTHLSDHATMVEWGGEVINTRLDGVHTATQMGSDHFTGKGFGRASYFHNLDTVDADNRLVHVPLDALHKQGIQLCRRWMGNTLLLQRPRAQPDVPLIFFLLLINLIV
jgi:hypothetical protein